MRSAQLEGFVTALRDAAADRSEAEMTVEEWRRAYDGLGLMLPAASEGVEVRRVDAGGVPAEWIVAEASGPTVVYLHGGGYCIGSLDSHRSMLTHLALAIDGRVLAVEYRLAPEDPYPAALDDAISAYRFAISSERPGRTVLAGDSAGGGLTLATLFALRDAGDPLPAAAVCLSPWADLTQSGRSMLSRAGADPMVHAEDLERWSALYRGPVSASDPRVSPIFGDFVGLPPLLLEVGTDEVLLDDARRVAEAAEGADLDVTLTVAEGMIHVWHFFAGAVPEADEGIARVAEFVRTRITPR